MTATTRLHFLLGLCAKWYFHIELVTYGKHCGRPSKSKCALSAGKRNKTQQRPIFKKHLVQTSYIIYYWSVKRKKVWSYKERLRIGLHNHLRHRYPALPRTGFADSSGAHGESAFITPITFTGSDIFTMIWRRRQPTYGDVRWRVATSITYTFGNDKCNGF